MDILPSAPFYRCLKRLLVFVDNSGAASAQAHPLLSISASRDGMGVLLAQNTEPKQSTNLDIDDNNNSENTTPRLQNI